MSNFANLEELEKETGESDLLKNTKVATMFSETENQKDKCPKPMQI